MTYIATFYSHFGAIRFKKRCGERGWTARVMPVPRTLSSSCGTCVRYECKACFFADCITEELEQIVEVTAAGYEQRYRAENG